MELWTYHNEDFSITSGKVIHSRSRYYQDTDGVPDAYKNLFARLDGFDQIIWCYTTHGQFKKTGVKCVEYHLSVSEEQIVAFLDEMIWNRILGIRCGLPRSLYRKFKKIAVAEYPFDSKASKERITKLTSEYWEQEPKTDNWWDELFVDRRPDDMTCALIRHPITPDSIINCTKM